MIKCFNEILRSPFAFPSVSAMAAMVAARFVIRFYSAIILTQEEKEWRAVHAEIPSQTIKRIMRLS